jgi:Arc/MetJ-type ribon-helix-helix transcriptional regulator
MRNIINISLPASLADEVDKEVRAGKFASKSEFFRHMLREYQIAKELERDRKAFEQGHGKVLKSLRSLR